LSLSISFNPLSIGSNRNSPRTDTFVHEYDGFNPLSIGSNRNEKSCMNWSKRLVSIPFLSGQIVIVEGLRNKEGTKSFNPLSIGSNRNEYNSSNKIMKIGVSIPFLSGQIVINWRPDE